MTVAALIACIAVVLLWIWLRAFVCWDDPFWGASVVCHLEVAALLLLIVPLAALYGLIRPLVQKRRSRDEQQARLGTNAAGSPTPKTSDEGASIGAIQFAQRIATRISDDYTSLPTEHRRHVSITLPVLLGALLVLALFLWRVRFNLFWWPY